MKRFFVLLLSFALASFAQQPTTLALSSPAPPAVNASAFIVGNGGSSTYVYWVVTNYPSGSVVSQAAIVDLAATTLTNTNYVAVGWNSQPGALTYDLIRAATFNGVSCTSCAVTTGLITTAYKDQGGALTTYAGRAPAQSGSGQFYINTRDFDVPEVRQVIGSTDYQASLIRGATLPNYCNVGDAFFLTGGSPGYNIYDCTSPNVWTMQGLRSATLSASMGTTAATVNTFFFSPVGGSAISTANTGVRWIFIPDGCKITRVRVYSDAVPGAGSTIVLKLQKATLTPGVGLSAFSDVDSTISFTATPAVMFNSDITTFTAGASVTVAGPAFITWNFTVSGATTTGTMNVGTAITCQ